MTANTMSPTELTAATIQLLCREIGVVNTVRFINQLTMGTGNYTEERKHLLDDLTVDEIVAEIEERRLAGKVGRRVHREP